jgi:hypothetical protein
MSSLLATPSSRSCAASMNIGIRKRSVTKPGTSLFMTTGSFPKEVMSVLTLDGLVAREETVWYLDRLSDRGRGEEVRPANLVGPPRGGGEVGDGDGGGVGEEEGVGRQDLVQRRKRLLFRCHPLNYGLDSRVYAAKILRFGRPVDAVVVLLRLLLREGALPYRA